MAFIGLALIETHDGAGDLAHLRQLAQELDLEPALSVHPRSQHVRSRSRPWLDYSWKGWWGGNPPYHAPTFVLTHYEREPVVMEGGTSFYFVTG